MPRDRLFLCLILAQAAHSIEEYAGRLYDRLAPARFVSGLISDNLATGFAIANAALFLFGVWCWAVPVRSNSRSAPAFIWFWTILEAGNGIGHCFLAASRGGYFPGLLTAPLLLFFAARLVITETSSSAD
jgi:hypothetical protein